MPCAAGGGKVRTVRDYQTEAEDWLCATRRGILKIPAGGGKTSVAAAAIDRVARSVTRSEPAKVTWLANTNEQVEQARQALTEFPAIVELCRVRVCCWQSAIDLTQEDLVVVDECHHAGSPVLSAMLATSPGARWGLSATPLGIDPDKNKVLLELFDWQLFEVKRERVVDGGHLTKAAVQMHGDSDLGLKELIDAEIPKLLAVRMKKMPYLDEAEQRTRVMWQLCQSLGIVGNSMRNRCIVVLCGGCVADSVSDSILILVGTVAHGEILAAEIPGAVVCHSGMGAKKRRASIAAFRDGTLSVMIATSLADEGLDVPRAGVLIYACAGRSSRAAEQRTGRVLRLFEGKERGVIHDFYDTQHPMLTAQSKSRVKLYKKLGYEILP